MPRRRTSRKPLTPANLLNDLNDWWLRERILIGSKEDFEMWASVMDGWHDWWMFSLGFPPPVMQDNWWWYLPQYDKTVTLVA